MNIKAYLEQKYGEHKIDGILAFFLMQDVKKYELFLQHITLTEYSDIEPSSYKIETAFKAKNIYNNDPAMLEALNILDLFNTAVKKYNTIITYGTFDLFHIGHLNLLKRIKDMCNNLIVGVSTDDFNAIKEKKCIIPYEQRAAIVAGCKYVDKVIPETDWSQKSLDIQKYKVNALVMGSDWTGKFDELKAYCDVVYLSRTDGISTTQIKHVLNNENNNTML